MKIENFSNGQVGSGRGFIPAGFCSSDAVGGGLYQIGGRYYINTPSGRLVRLDTGEFHTKDVRSFRSEEVIRCTGRVVVTQIG